MNKSGRSKSSELSGIWGLIGLVIVGILLLGVSSSDTSGVLSPIGIFLIIIGIISIIIFFIKYANK